VSSLGRASGVNRQADLLEESEVVAMVPDLDDLAILETEDAGCKEGCVTTRGR
jgi:hypothetical protein